MEYVSNIKKNVTVTVLPNAAFEEQLFEKDPIEAVKHDHKHSYK